ncbi:hypothetical protein D9615_007853 [Tricholomella constricta]|uniref:AMP-dependent synthetase/ligase domain-containing protein n=1 Tax=Tricholomella constricta TaxID=117010 RepID=A0A8H5H4P9_9AGAR|nr:hypothetical protein D9615_007853 [Tricholomella constricta]
MLESHLTVLESSAARHSFSPVFKVPQLDLSSGCVESWASISYQRFLSDVEFYARHWRRTFTRDGIPPKSVIGIWVGGFTYTDVLHIYGISRAGYIPQLFSLRLPNPVVVYELLQKADARTLVYDPTYEHILKDCLVPLHPAADLSVSDADDDEDLPDISHLTPEDIAFVFHTSGSTSGSPKLVPCSFSWLNSTIEKSKQICQPQTPGRQDVTVWMGSMCHIAQTFMLIGSLQHGSCVIQPTAITFPTTELVDMIHRAGLNRLNQFATFLAKHLKASRNDSKLLTLLGGLDDILYSGLPLPREDEEWAFRNGLKLRNLFGSTECGAMLLSVGASGRNPALLQSLDGFNYRFVSTAPAASAGHQSTARLMELIIPAESPDCPDISLRHADGDFHTGDLFQEASPGLYVFRGRDDDWIKSENSLRCDTKAIEDNALAMCGNLIAQCVVVGSGRPSPVMFIEPASDMEPEKLKKEIIRKTRHFHSRRYLHERITLTDMIVVVPPQSLPRTATKGNIRRKAVEEAFKPQIDSIFERAAR